MNRSLICLGLLASLGLSACGDSSASGIEGGKKFSELSAAETRSLCDWYALEVGGPPGEMMCSDNVSASIQTVDECVADVMTASACTVKVFEECTLATEGNPCAVLQNAKCGGYIACIFSSL